MVIKILVAYDIPSLQAGPRLFMAIDHAQRNTSSYPILKIYVLERQDSCILKAKELRGSGEEPGCYQPFYGVDDCVAFRYPEFHGSRVDV